jgi:DNA-directed RNA polymerase subunit RPC12/RpoP
VEQGDKIICPYCSTEFEHNGKVELQKCPGCGAELLCGDD